MGFEVVWVLFEILLEGLLYPQRLINNQQGILTIGEKGSQIIR